MSAGQSLISHTLKMAGAGSVLLEKSNRVVATVQSAFRLSCVHKKSEVPFFFRYHDTTRVNFFFFFGPSFLRVAFSQSHWLLSITSQEAHLYMFRLKEWCRIVTEKMKPGQTVKEWGSKPISDPLAPHKDLWPLCEFFCDVQNLSETTKSWQTWCSLSLVLL